MRCVMSVSKSFHSENIDIDTENKKERFCIELCRSIFDFQKYLELFPLGKYIDVAKFEIEKLSQKIDKKFIKDCKVKIANAQTEEAINLLISRESDYYDDFILISTRWNIIKARELKGISEPFDENEKVKINNSILEFLKLLEQKL